MGKYSLENYECYSTIKCRPKEIATNIENVGSGIFHRLPCRWEDTEPQQGDFSFDGIRESLAEFDTNTVLLELCIEPPFWAKSLEEEKAIYEYLDSWVRRAATELGGGESVFGVFVRFLEDNLQSKMLWDSIFHAFDCTWKILPIINKHLINYSRCLGLPFGILVELGTNPYNSCDLFARYELQRVWEHAPVLVRDTVGNPETLSALARQWHAVAVEDTDVGVGFCLSLRRLTYPAKLTSGGAFPLRFWWVNSGKSPCYHQTQTRLRILKEGVPHNSWEISLTDMQKIWPIGDRVWNEITWLPNVPEGEYLVQCGVFLQNGLPLNLAIEDYVGDGFYTIGRVSIDKIPRPELESVWDSYYPEGYYPLEDPAVPSD